MGPLESHRLRAEFPGLEGCTYLNSAAESCGSRRMAAALQRYAEDKQRGARGREAMYATEQACRVRAADLLGCNAAEIAFCSSTTEALNTVLLGVDWHPGDNVVTTDLEFPSALIACLNLGERLGVEVRVVPHVAGTITPDALAARIDDRTRLVLVSHVSFRSGYRLDLGAVGAAAHRHGALLLVDAAQSVGAVHIPAVASGAVDFLAACTFKWMLASHGLAVLYCNRDRLDAIRPPAVGWRSVQDYLGVLPALRFQLQPDARRFETGMLDYSAIYALHEGLGLLAETGATAVETRVLAISDVILRGLRDLGVTPLTPAAAAQRAGIVAFETERFAEVGKALDAQGIHCWYRDGRVRASAHAYNTEEEGRAFCAALRRLL